MDRQALDLLNLTSLLIFIILLVLAVARIGYRYLSYKKEGVKVPALLYRDGFFLTGLSLPFLGVLLFRGLGIVANIQPWYPFWIIASNGFAIAATAYWVYYEYFRIEQ